MPAAYDLDSHVLVLDPLELIGRNGASVAVSQQNLRILAVLVTAGGADVTRGKLGIAGWGKPVDRTSVYTAIKLLRKIFGRPAIKGLGRGKDHESSYRYLGSCRPTERWPSNANGLVRLTFHTWARERAGVGELLRPDSVHAVPFHGRRFQLDQLREWCVEGSALAVRTYTGSGGIGKTRFLFQACTELRQIGWRTGFLDLGSPEDLTGARISSLFADSSPAFIAIDYADTHPGEVAALLRCAAGTTHKRIRIALLARTAATWLDRLSATNNELRGLLNGPAASVLAIGPVALTEDERIDSYNSALVHFSSVLELPVPEVPLPSLAAPSYERILLIQAKALATVDAVAADGERGLLHYLLLREQEQWTHHVHAAGLKHDFVDAVRESLAVVTLCNGVQSYDEAMSLIGDTPFLKDRSVLKVSRVLGILQMLYPDGNGVGPLLPDALGDHLVDIELARQPKLMQLSFRA